MKPTIIRGDERENALEVREPASAVLLVMRRPAMVRNRDRHVRWLVWCQVELALGAPGTGSSEAFLITVPAHPPRQHPTDPQLVTDELDLPPLASNPRAVALACFPLPVAAWRFEFYTEEHQDPDATAEAWALPIQAQHAECGFFKTPHRSGFVR